MSRRVLFLQGPSSLFFDLLGDAVVRRGAEALRIGFCLGDRLYWRGGKPFELYAGDAAAWGAEVEALLAARGATDVVMLGDARPRHRAAAAAARAVGATAHVVEHGYFRPDWLTHEIGGMGARSGFRAALDAGAIDLDAYAEEIDDDATAIYQKSFAAYAAMDVVYNLSTVLSRPFYAPRYAGHSSVWPVVEYAGWARKLVVAPARARRADAALDAALSSGAPFYLWALQLEQDFQIRVDGLGRPQTDLIPEILGAFAAHAPADARLLVKAHPLDNLWTPWARLLRRAATAAGVAGRVVFLDGGDLDAAIRASRGVLSVNSTVGLRAVALGAPTLALAPAIYDLPGLTLRGGLGALPAFFADGAAPPDRRLAARFLNALKAATQLRGGFDGAGARPGADALAERILSHSPIRALQNSGLVRGGKV